MSEILYTSPRTQKVYKWTPDDSTYEPSEKAMQDIALKVEQIETGTEQSATRAFTSAVGQGFTTFPGTVFQGFGAMVGSTKMEEAGKQYAEEARSTFPIDPLRREDLSTKAGQAVGQGLAQLGLALGTGGGSLSTGAVLASAAGMGAASGAERSAQDGLTGARRMGRVYGSALVELGSERIFGLGSKSFLSPTKIPNTLGGKVLRAAGTTAGEGGEEIIAGVGNNILDNLTAVGLDIPTPDIVGMKAFKSYAEQGFLGMVGGTVFAGAQLALGGQATENPITEEDAAQAPTPGAQDILTRIAQENQAADQQNAADVLTRAAATNAAPPVTPPVTPLVTPPVTPPVTPLVTPPTGAAFPEVTPAPQPEAAAGVTTAPEVAPVTTQPPDLTAASPTNLVDVANAGIVEPTQTPPPDATQVGQVPESNLGQYPNGNEVGTAPEAGDSNRPVEGGQVEQAPVVQGETVISPEVQPTEEGLLNVIAPREKGGIAKAADDLVKGVSGKSKKRPPAAAVAAAAAFKASTAAAAAASTPVPTAPATPQDLVDSIQNLTDQITGEAAPASTEQISPEQGAVPTGSLPAAETPMTRVSGGGVAATTEAAPTPKPDPRDKIYAELLAKGTPVGENLVELTEKQVSPALRKKLQSDRDTAAGNVSRPQETESFYLRYKGDVTGNPSDRGWILKDKRPDFARRFAPAAQIPAPAAATPTPEATPAPTPTAAAPAPAPTPTAAAPAPALPSINDIVVPPIPEGAPPVEGAVNMFNIEDGEPSQFVSEENPESLKDIQSYTVLTDELIIPSLFNGSAAHTPQNKATAYKYMDLLQTEEGSKAVRDFAMKFDPVLGDNDALNGGILGQVFIYANAENDGGKMLSDLRSVGSRFYYSKSGTGQSSARGLGIVGWITKNLVRAKAMQTAENGRNKDAASRSGVASKDLEDLGSAVKAAVPTAQENQTALGEATTSAGSVDDVLSSFVGTVPTEPVIDTRVTPGEQTPADVAPAVQAEQERLEQEAKGQDPDTNEQVGETVYTKVDGAVTNPTINATKARELIAKKLGFTPKNVSYENTDIPNENGNQYSGKVNLATKQITINLRNIKDSAHLEDVLMEEMDHLVYADPMVQAEISLLSENLPDDIKAEVASLPYKPEVQREEATIRFMRRLANEPNTSSLWKRFVDSVRAAFRRLFNGRLTERDLKMAADRVAARSFRAMAAQSNRTGTRFSFAGEQSIKNLSGERRKFMADSLDAAKAMAAAGKSSEEIRAVTGWFPGTYDGKLRYEIPDSKASFASTDVYNEKTTQAYGGQAFNRITVSSMIDRVKSGKVVKLSDVFQHDELFAAYPEAANISFFPIAGNVVQGSHRVIDGKDVITATITIAADGSISAASTSTILHELQHFIQQREGFAVGGSPDNLVTASDLTDAAKFGDGMRGIQKYEAEIAGLVRVLEEERAKKSFMGFGGPNQKTIKALEDSIARVQESVNSIWAYQKKNLNIDKDSTRASLLSAINRVDSKLGGTWVLTKRNEGLDMLYRLLSGEIEARDVQARQNLTPEQLRATAPYSSENIAKEDAIVMFGSGGPQASMSMPSPEAQRIDQEYMAAVESGDMKTAQRLVDEAAKAAAKPFNVKTQKKGFSTETAVSVGDKTVSVFRDPENGYWYFADKGGLGNYIATSKEKAIQAALERIEDEQGGAKASTTVQFRDWRKRTTITLPGFYLRFGDLPKGGKSVKGNQPGEFEQGVSVLKAWRSPNGVFVISSYTSETGSSDMVSGLENRPVFIAYGEDTGKVGSDGEPLLKDVVLTEQVINSLITVDDPSYIDQPITNNRTTYDKWKTIEPAPDPLASAETVVRDDAGNIIPPSKRFEEDSDIRYSLPDPNEPAPAVPDVGPDAYTEEVAAVEAIPEATKKKAKDKVKKKTKVAKEVADPNVKAVENFIAAFKRNSGVEKADAEPKAQAKAKEILARYTKLPDRKKGSGYALTEAGQDAFMYNLNQELVDLGVPIDLASEATDYAWARYSTKRQKQIDNKALAKAKKEIRERERQANRPEKEAQAALDKPNNTAKAFINKQDLSQTETLTGTKPKKIDPVAQALSDWTNVQDLSTAFDSSPQARNAYMTGLSSKLMSLGVDSQTAWTASNRAWSKYQTALSAKVEAFRRRFEANKASTILGEELSKIPVYLQNDVEFVKAYFKKLLIFGGIPEQVAEAGTTMYTARYIDLLKNVKTKRATRFIENEASAKTKKVLTEKPNEYTKLMTAVRLGVTDPSHTVSMAFSSPSKYQVFTQADHDQMIAWEKEIHDGDTPNLIKVELAKKILGLADARMNDFNAINAFTGYLVGNTLSGIGTAAIQIWTPAYSMGNRLATDGMRGLMTGDPKRFLASWSAFVNSADTVTKEFKYAFGNDVYRRGQQAELQSLSALRKVLDKNIAIYQNPKSGKEKVVAAAKIALSAPDYVRRLYSSMDSASQSLFINQIRQVGLYDLLRKNGMDMNAFNTMLEAKRAHRDGIITTLTLEGNYTPTQIRLIAEDSAIEDFGARVAAAIGNDGAKQVRDLFRTSVTEGKSDIGVNDEVDGHVIPAILKILKGIESSVDAVAGEKGQGAGQLAFRVIVGYPTTALKVLNRSLYFFPPTAASRYLLNRYYEKQPGFDPEAKRVYPLLETHSQKLQRLAEAAMGTMALTILIGLLWDDKDKEEKDRRFIVHNLGPSDRAAKQAWRAAGNVPQSIQWRASETSPWISVSWAKAGLEALAPVLATVGTITDVGDQATEDTTLSDNIIGSIGGVMGVFNRPLSGINDIGEILSGEKNSVSQKSLASYTAFRASGLVPFSSLLKTVNRMEGPRDMSTPTSTMLSQIPIAGPMLTEPAINMFGDPLGATPNELSYKLPIFPVQVGIRRQDVPFYEKILSKGQYPPLKLRTNFEKTYGPVSDLVWRQYVEKRGQMVKKLIIDRWTDLDKLSPEAYDKVLGKFANAADDVAIQELNIRRLPK